MPSVWSMASRSSTSGRSRRLDTTCTRYCTRETGLGGLAPSSRFRQKVVRCGGRRGRRGGETLCQDGGGAALKFIEFPQYVVLQGVNVRQARGGGS